MLRALALVVAAMVIIASGCGSKAKQARPQPRLVSPADFAAAVTEPGTVTINVLGPGAPSVPGTDLFISVDQLTASRNELPPQTTKLAVYCAHGGTSAVAVPILEQMGYENIVELDGGMAAWQASGRSLLPPAGASTGG